MSEATRYSEPPIRVVDPTDAYASPFLAAAPQQAPAPAPPTRVASATPDWLARPEPLPVAVPAPVVAEVRGPSHRGGRPPKKHGAARLVVGIMKVASLVSLIAGPLAVPAYLIAFRDRANHLSAGVVLAVVFADVVGTIFFATLLALPALLLEATVDVYDEHVRARREAS